jgi:hypothetical protein
MGRQRLWWGAVFAIAGLGIAAIVHVSGAPGDDFQLGIALLTSLLCGAIGLGGLALLRRPQPLAWLGWLLLAWTVVSYTLLELAVWDERFAEHHGRLLGVVLALALAAALIAPLAAQIRDASPALRLITIATLTAIATTAGYSIALVLDFDEPSRGEVRAFEVLWTISLVGFFATPFAQRALERVPQRPPAGTTPSPSP